MHKPTHSLTDLTELAELFEQLNPEDQNLALDIIWMTLVEAGKADEVRAKLGDAP